MVHEEQTCSCSKLSNQALKKNWYAGPSLKDAWDTWRLKIGHEQKSVVFKAVLPERLPQNDQSLVIFICVDGKQLFFCVYGAICQFYPE